MDTKAAEPQRGALLGGRYRIMGVLSRGGLATVLQALDERLGRPVAIKLLHASAVAPGDAGPAGSTREGGSAAPALRRLMEEAVTVAQLGHPNVVAVYDQGTHEGSPYLVMEHVRGRTLRRVLADRGRLDPAESLAVLEQILAALSVAHRIGLVHRDVKPENILIAPPPNGSGDLVDAVVKVADFGLAQPVDVGRRGRGNRPLATAEYVAPELVSRRPNGPAADVSFEGPADPRSDVYSSGIVLFEMLTGRVPFTGERPADVAWQHVDRDVPPPSTVVSGLPKLVDDLVLRATARDPANRPRDAAAMLAEIRTARDDLGALAGPTRMLAQSTTVLPSLPDDRPPWARLPRPDSSRASRMRTRRLAPAQTGPPGRRGPGTPPIPGRAPGHGYDPRIGPGYGPDRGYGPAPAGGYGGYPGGGPGSGGGSKLHRFFYRIADSGRSGLRSADNWLRGVRSNPGSRQRLIAIAVVFGVLLVGGGWWLGFGRYTSAPTLIELTKENAEAEAFRLGFRVEYAAGIFSEQVPIDTVIRQDPPPGGRILKGGVLTLVLSLGPERYPVPDVSGQLLDFARSRIVEARLVPQEADGFSDTLPIGYVVGTEPPAGELLAPGSVVKIIVAKGPFPAHVPSVVGLRLEEAERLLKEAGFGLSVEWIEDQDHPRDYVLEQDPPGGTGMEKATGTVKLKVASGPPGTEMPNVVGQPCEQAANQLRALGLDVEVKGGNNPFTSVRQQSPAPGEIVEEGRRVTIRCGVGIFD